MALPNNTTISLNQVNTELGLSATANISLNQAAVRTLAGVASGTISMSNLWGKSNKPVISGGSIVDSGGYRYHFFDSTGTLTVTSLAGALNAEVSVIGGGGGGGKDWGGGGGGGGAASSTFALSVTNYAVTVGAGGAQDGAGGAAAGNSGSASSINGVTGNGGGGGGYVLSGAGLGGGCGGGGGRLGIERADQGGWC